jgi:hypothetical protein
VYNAQHDFVLHFHREGEGQGKDGEGVKRRDLTLNIKVNEYIFEGVCYG